MDFSQAAAQFRLFDQQFRSGQITYDQYRAAVAQLQVVDAQGNFWQMQEQTGAWFMLWQGQWVPATPPGMAVPPPQISSQPPQMQYPPQSYAPRKRSPWAVIGIVSGSLALFALVVVGLLSLLKGGGAARNPKTYDLQEQRTLTLNPGQGSLQDENGTTLAVDAEALPAEDSVAQLKVYQAGGELEKALSEEYLFVTPLYEVTLQGQNDGNSPASLSFPAANADSRLLMIIDMQAALLLEVEPVEGVLTTEVHLGPEDLSVLYPDGDEMKDHSLLYAVVNPLKPASLVPGGSSPGVVLAGNRISQETFGKSCSPISLKAVTLFQRCQSNEDGTVMVIYPVSNSLTHIDAYHVAKEIESAMSAYATAGFSKAALSASSPLLAVVSESYTSPEYNFKNGVIYLPTDIPTKLEAERTGIWHETAHWIQNRVYSLALAKASGARSWWLDVSAELMVMEVMPAYIANNLSVYGKITTADNVMFAFQSAPYQWPADFYVHAQLVKVNICDLGCPLTANDFHTAINNGRYPFNSNYERERLTSNLEDYARYLVGAAPQKANSGISLAGVQTQDAYGQVISVLRENESLVKFIHNGVEPQIKEEKTPVASKLLINAAIEKDGVYPLQVTSGSEGKYTGLPLMLIVEPGVPFLYREDGGEVQSSDGGKEVKIGPLQAGTGVGTVRLVAFSQAGGQNFKARIEPINLDGTWVIKPGEVISSSMTCGGGGLGDEVNDPDDIGRFGADYYNLVSAMGEMTTDESGQTLEWSLLPERLVEGASADSFTFEALAITETDGIHLQGKLYVPNPGSSSSYLPGMDLANGSVAIIPLNPAPPQPAAAGKPALAMLVLLPAAGIGLLPAGLSRASFSKKRQRLTTILVIGLMAWSLAGCIGVALYGTFEADVKITKFEYAGGSGEGSLVFGGEATGDPVWVFTEGTGTYPIELHIDTEDTDSDGNVTKTEEICSGTITFNVTGGVYEDMTVSVPSVDDE